MDAKPGGECLLLILTRHLGLEGLCRLGCGGQGGGLKGPHDLDSGGPLMTSHLQGQAWDLCCPCCGGGSMEWLRVGYPPAWKDRG